MTKTTKITLENCGPENEEFNREWHLASANRIGSCGKPYARAGEAIITANVGAWYNSACYWRDQAEKAKVEGLRMAEEIAGKWAKSKSCDEHDDNPCCHVRTGQGIFDAVRSEREKVGNG